MLNKDQLSNLRKTISELSAERYSYDFIERCSYQALKDEFFYDILYMWLSFKDNKFERAELILDMLDYLDKPVNKIN